MLYRDLFKVEEIAGNPMLQAKLLAGIAHGYFYSSAYTDRKVTVALLIDGYQSYLGLALLLQGTTYLHAGFAIAKKYQRRPAIDMTIDIHDYRCFTTDESSLWISVFSPASKSPLPALCNQLPGVWLLHASPVLGTVRLSLPQC